MDDTRTVALDRTTRMGLILLALAQGCVLYLLYLAMDEKAWPATDPRWLKALYTVVVALPVVFYLGVERLVDRRNLAVAGVLGTLLFFLGWHLGWVGMGERVPRNGETFVAAYVLSLQVALFVLTFFFRVWSVSGKLRFDYGQLLAFSWQQALTLGLLCLFVFVFWLLLWLWGRLFDVIGIEMFKELFEEPVFAYPVTGLVAGFGLVLIRERIRLIATVQFMCEVLIKALLPIAAVIVVLFLGVLPVTGLQPIWDTGKAAQLMMLLTLVLLFFFNAVLSGDPERPPYPAAMRWLVYASVVLAPVSTLLAAWALWLRIDQHGLTLDRLWAGVILLLIAAYAFTYALLLLWKRDGALWPIQAANKRLALAVAAVLIAVNTPLADLRAWAAGNQVERLLSGKVSADSFDYGYLRFSLGAYGDRALREIEQSDLAQENPVIGQRVADVLTLNNRWDSPLRIDASDMAAVAEAFVVVPAEEPLPETLLRELASSHDQCLRAPGSCRVLRMPDFPDSGWIVLHSISDYYVRGDAYVLSDQAWRKIGRIADTGDCGKKLAAKLLEEAPFVRVPGPFLAYHAGQCFFNVLPEQAYLRELSGQEADGAGQ